MQSSSDELNPRSRRGSIHSISELGIRRPRYATQTFLGWSRTFSSLTRWELLYLVISLFSIVGAIGTTIERVVIIPKECDDVVIAVILLINSLFCLVYILRGIFFELPYELLVFVLTVVVVVIYVFISYFGFCPPPPNQVDSGKNSINTACDVTSCPIKLSRLIVASVVSPILICLGLFLISKQFSSWNLVFRSVGGASRLQSAAKLHYAFQSLLWFDFQTDISMVILCLRGGFQELNKTEVLILTIGSLYCVTTRVIAYFAIRRESLILCWIYWISFPVVPAYVIYELDTPATGVLDYGAAVLDKTAYFTGILGVVLKFSSVALLIWIVYGRKYFGIGLKEALYSGTHLSDDEDARSDITFLHGEALRIQVPQRTTEKDWHSSQENQLTKGPASNNSATFYYGSFDAGN